jgi:hypothetical protein
MLLIRANTTQLRKKKYLTRLWERLSGKPPVHSVESSYQRSPYKAGQEARIRYPARRYYREDLGCEFKSSMEANYARFLNFKGVKWEYEREIFTFPYHASKIGITRYKPDFKVYFGKTAYYIEVKGYLDRADSEKIYLFQKYYPWLKLNFITPRQYNLIRKYYSKYIPCWE